MVNRSFQIVVFWFGIKINNRVAGNLNIDHVWNQQHPHQPNQLRIPKWLLVAVQILEGTWKCGTVVPFFETQYTHMKKTWNNRKTKFNNHDYHKVPTNKNTQTVTPPMKWDSHTQDASISCKNCLASWTACSTRVDGMSKKHVYRMVGE